MTALSTLMSQCVSEPVRCWHTPTRPYATARSASANSRASRAIVASSTPAIGAARASGQSAASASIVAIPSAWSSRWPSRVRPSANSTCSIPSSRYGSPPGAIATCSEACAAVSVRRGSTTTTVPPRATIARSRWRAPGAVMSEPFDTDGFAPSTSMWSVRSMSGIGNSARFPNISADVRCCGSWSADVAE